MPPKTQTLDNGKTKFIVSDNFDQRYQVNDKSVPGAPDTVPANNPHKDKGKKINWVTKYGFKLKPGASAAGTNLDDHGFVKGNFSEKYTVQIEKLGNTVWCWDGSSLSEVPATTVSIDGKSYLQFTLDKGDPMLGMT